MLVIQRGRQDDHKFKLILGCVASLRPGWDGEGKSGEKERKRDTVGRKREGVRKGESGRESQIKTQLMETNWSRGSSSAAECSLRVHKALGWTLSDRERVTEGWMGDTQFLLMTSYLLTGGDGASG